MQLQGVADNCLLCRCTWSWQIIIHDDRSNQLFCGRSDLVHIDVQTCLNILHVEKRYKQTKLDKTIKDDCF
ncbi:hypothetical protein BDF14DRAFT_1860926 [Spinellus fusiger]|nr:hypothetical protein BDF14DRAFT_1860926 [Spinellus fusiger]